MLPEQMLPLSNNEKIVHVLNGDALLERFPAAIPGLRIVAREALSEGPLGGNTLKAFFDGRATYLNEKYGTPSSFYYQQTVTEFQRLQGIDKDARVFLWFEDDVFCQLNCWFVTYLLVHSGHSGSCFVVRPPNHTPYSFGGLDEGALLNCFRSKPLPLDTIAVAQLWQKLSTGDLNAATQCAAILPKEYHFLQSALQAYLEAFPGKGQPGRPKSTLIRIVADLKTSDFSSVFHEFSNREPIYGYSDLQVMQLLNQLRADALI